jgi:small subunit ribosomal protein S20
VPNILSAKKRLRQSEKRAKRNAQTRSRMKTLIKKAFGAANEETVRLAVQAVDKAAKRNVIHANKAARLKSRLMRGRTKENPGVLS